jgi:hypothetical protein
MAAVMPARKSRLVHDFCGQPNRLKGHVTPTALFAFDAPIVIAAYNNPRLYHEAVVKSPIASTTKPKFACDAAFGFGRLKNRQQIFSLAVKN